MDALTRHRTLALLGIVDYEFRKLPRDGDGDGFYSPRKGMPDRTPLPAGMIGAAKAPKPAAAPDGDQRAAVEKHVAHWHSDLSDMDDLLDAVGSGTRPVSLVQRGQGTRAALVDYGDGSTGIVTRYLGTPDRDSGDQADADQLGAALARAIDIPAPRVLRVDDERSASDSIDGQPWTDDEEMDSEAGLRLGLLDLLLGIDSRDPGTVVVGPDGVVPVQHAQAFADVPLPAPVAKDKRTERLEQLAAAIDAAGPAGLSRSDIAARLGNPPAATRDKLLAELVDSGAYLLVPSSTGNTGHGARFVRLESADPPDFARRPGMAPPETAGEGLEFWHPFVDDGAWSYNPLTALDIEWLRDRLDDVRPEFEHLGREHWWQFAMDRLARLSNYADGGRDLFATTWQRYDAANGS